MSILAAVLGSFLFAGYVQTHEVGRPETSALTDSHRFIHQSGSEFENVVSTRTVCPLDLDMAYTPIFGSGKEPRQ